MGIGDELQEGLTNASSIIGENPLVSVGVAATTGAVLGSAITGAIVGVSAKKKKSSKKKSKKHKKKYSKRSKKRGKYYPYTARKRKDRSRKRIRFTKNGQPYVLTSSGKARFIKRSSARRSKKLKGGYY